MKITELKPMLWTEDLKGSINFYVNTLGFTADEVSDEWGWATLSICDVAIMLAKPNEHTRYEKIGFTGSFYFTVEGVDELWEKLRDKAPICYGIEDFYYGMREFAVYDNNGYLLQFGQETANKE